MTPDELNAAFDSFLQEHNNTFLEVVDPSAKNQCFDLVVGWCDKIGIPRVLQFQRASQIYTDFSPAQALYFDRIPNTPDFIPQKGDIGVWDGWFNPTWFGLRIGAGHTGVATGKGDASLSEWFEQNDPTGSNSHVRQYNKNHFLGVLRPKVTISQPTMDDKRPYWFDLMNSVIWNKPHEEITDVDVQKFVSEYPSQLARSGKWDLLAQKAGFSGDTNQISVDYMYATLTGKLDEFKKALSDLLAKF